VTYFAAIAIPVEIGAELGSQLGAIRFGSGYRAEHVDRYHVTLAYYGLVEDSELVALKHHLEEAANRSAPFSLRLSSLGTFPNAAVIWAGVKGDVSALRQLRQLVTKSTASIGTASENPGGPVTTFRPHVTVARYAPELIDPNEASSHLRTHVSTEPFRVESFSLYQTVKGEYLTRFTQHLGAHRIPSRDSR